MLILFLFFFYVSFSFTFSHGGVKGNIEIEVIMKTKKLISCNETSAKKVPTQKQERKTFCKVST